jgi:hypothetical protein
MIRVNTKKGSPIRINSEIFLVLVSPDATPVPDAELSI